MVNQLLSAIVRRGLASGVSLGATAYLAHQFATSTLGTFLGMLALGQLLTMIFSAGLEVSPIYLLRNYSGQMPKIWIGAVIISVGLAMGCLALGAAVPLLIDNKSNELFAWGIAPFVYAAANIILLPQLACLQGLLRLQIYNVLQVGYPLTFLILVVIVDNSSVSLTPKLAIYCWAVASVGIAAASAAVLLPEFFVHLRRSSGNAPPPLWALVGFSLKSYFANCIGTLNSRLPNLLAALLLAPIAASQFAGAVFLSDVFSFFSLAIASVTLPLLAGIADPAERVSKLGRACRLNTTATLVTVLVFLALFEPLCSLLLGSSFATPGFRLMATAVLLCAVAHSTARLLCTDFTSQGKPLLSALPNVPAACVFAATFWLLHDWAEPWGAVLAYCASSLCFSVLTFVLYRNSFKIDLRVVGVVTRTDVKVAIAAIQRRWQP